MIRRSSFTYIVAAVMLMLATDLHAQKFAIITDKASYENARKEIDLYASTLGAEGLKTVIIIDKWGHPDSIRFQLKGLYQNNKGFEGAVFIGNIPIPMIRDAQHMTSAFKMDQERYPWERSSVTSDRFYEDFDLKFTYLKQDTADKNLHYYSLKFDSPQKLDPEIYTGRIRIPWDKDFSLLKKYLNKAVAAHREQNKVDEILLFAGHGYNSESMVARLDEKVALLQQFPLLNKQQNGLEYIDFSFEDHIKFRLLSTLSARDLDIAFLHHHGDTDMELLDGEPAAIGVQNNIESVKYFLRSKVRDAKDPAATRKNYIEWLGVPESWFQGADDKAQTLKDSLYSANMDIIPSDIRKYHPRPKFMIFDACFNGSFQLEDYISGEYVFGNAEAIAAQANTVNSLQDKFPDNMSGLLGLGMRVGEWNKMTCFLETHITGDPTFRFTPSGPMTAEKMLSAKADNKSLLALAGYDHPDVQAWALRQLMKNRYQGAEKLITDKFFSSPWGTTRLVCLNLLAAKGGDSFIKVLSAAFDDSYELVRRFACIWAEESGDPRLVQPIIKTLANPNISKREEFQLSNAIGFYDRDLLVAELDKVFSKTDTTGNHFGFIYSDTRKKIEASCKSTDATTAAIIAAETAKKSKIFEIKSLRNETYHTEIPELCKFLLACDDEQLQLLLTEALGWFSYSYNKKSIIETCTTLAQSEKLPASVRNEASRTVIRLSPAN